jgi:hypothetical protein
MDERELLQQAVDAVLDRHTTPGGDRIYQADVGNDGSVQWRNGPASMRRRGSFLPGMEGDTLNLQVGLELNRLRAEQPQQEARQAMVALYRGVKPEGMAREGMAPLGDDEQRDLDSLIAKFNTPDGLTPAETTRMGELLERNGSSTRFFTDDPDTARHYAGDEGSVFRLDVPMEDATQWMTPTGMLPGPNPGASTFAVPWDRAQDAAIPGAAAEQPAEAPQAPVAPRMVREPTPGGGGRYRPATEADEANPQADVRYQVRQGGRNLYLTPDEYAAWHERRAEATGDEGEGGAEGAEGGQRGRGIWATRIGGMLAGAGAGGLASSFAGAAVAGVAAPLTTLLGIALEQAGASGAGVMRIGQSMVELFSRGIQVAANIGGTVIGGALGFLLGGAIGGALIGGAAGTIIGTVGGLFSQIGRTIGDALTGLAQIARDTVQTIIGLSDAVMKLSLTSGMGVGAAAGAVTGLGALGIGPQQVESMFGGRQEFLQMRLGAFGVPVERGQGGDMDLLRTLQNVGSLLQSLPGILQRPYAQAMLGPAGGQLLPFLLDPNQMQQAVQAQDDLTPRAEALKAAWDELRVPVQEVKLLWENVKVEFVAGFIPLIRNGIETLLGLWQTHQGTIVGFFQRLPSMALTGLGRIADWLQDVYNTWREPLTNFWNGFLAGLEKAIDLGTQLLGMLENSRILRWVGDKLLGPSPAGATAEPEGQEPWRRALRAARVGGEEQGGDWRETGMPPGARPAAQGGGMGGLAIDALIALLAARLLGLGGGGVAGGAARTAARWAAPAARAAARWAIPAAGTVARGVGAWAAGGGVAAALGTPVAAVGLAPIAAGIAAAALAGWGIGTLIRHALNIGGAREEREAKRETREVERGTEELKERERRRGGPVYSDVAEEMGLRKKWEQGELTPEESAKLEAEFRRRREAATAERRERGELPGQQARMQEAQPRWGDYFRNLRDQLAQAQNRPIKLEGDIQVKTEHRLEPTDMFNVQMTAYEVMQSHRAVQLASA